MNARSIMCWMAVAVAAIAAAIAATPLNDIPGTTEVYSAAETDAAITAATNSIKVEEADFTPSNAVLVATIEEVAPPPGNYATVSNRAMSAIQSLEPATNYTDAAIAALGSVLRGTIAESAQASTNYVDELETAYAIGNKKPLASTYANYSDSANYLVDENRRIYPQDIARGATNAAVAVAAAKQDALPFPTNAIPISVISGAPSLAGQTFDFSRNYDIIRVTAAIAEALGATITNNPTAQGGN